MPESSPFTTESKSFIYPIAFESNQNSSILQLYLPQQEQVGKKTIKYYYILLYHGSMTLYYTLHKEYKKILATKIKCRLLKLPHQDYTNRYQKYIPLILRKKNMKLSLFFLIIQV